MKKLLVLTLFPLSCFAQLTPGIIPVAIPPTAGATSSLSNSPLSVASSTNLTLSGNFAPYSITLGGSNILDIITNTIGIPSLAPFVPAGNDVSLPGVFSASTIIADTLSVGLITVTNNLVVTNASFTGGTTIGATNNDLTASRALISSPVKVVTNSVTTATELGYVNGVTSAIQTQLNAKQASFTTGIGITNNGGVLSNNIVAGSNVTITGGANGQLSIASSGSGSSAGVITWTNVPNQNVTSSTTFVDWTGSGQAILANRTYIFEARVWVTQASTVAGWKISVNGPTSPTLLYYIEPSYGNSAVNVGAVGTTYDAAITGGTGSAATRLVHVVGRIANGSTAGTLTVRIAQSVSDGNATGFVGSVGLALID